MYERAGYRPIERYNDNPYAERFFAKAAARRLTASAVRRRVRRGSAHRSGDHRGRPVGDPMDRYGRDVLAGPRHRSAPASRPVPGGVRARGRGGRPPAGSGPCCASNAPAGCGVVVLEDRHGRDAGRSRSDPGFWIDGAARRAHPAGRRRPRSPHRHARLRDRAPSPALGPGWRAAAGSGSRASTMPPWSNAFLGRRPAHRGHRGGTAERHRRPAGRGGAGVRAESGTAGSACSSTIWCPVPRRAASWRAVTDPGVLVTGHPYIDIWQAVEARADRLQEVAAHPAQTARGRRAVCEAFGWPHARPGGRRHRAGGGSAAPCATTAISSRRCSAGWKS